MTIAALLFISSLQCYSMLRKFDIWPSRQTVENRLRTTFVTNIFLVIHLGQDDTKYTDYDICYKYIFKCHSSCQMLKF